MINTYTIAAFKPPKIDNLDDNSIRLPTINKFNHKMGISSQIGVSFANPEKEIYYVGL